ncbi:hypothetical protein [Hymenobacter metallilatus]|uniref:Uncharacterized protein n=1 Tax=Hymenobacter metallilatus TaxID=2493666 RepID=A0A3R9M7I2_9BACT|nr:hypothetical protein [Hymenobacter metallilatus]RSK24083.1 hypothetical protein EI290_21035 [Hymenobacter metallilatus]
MKQLPGYLLLLLLPLVVRAQRGGEGFTQQFNRATVLLSTGDTLVGPVVLHRTEETLTMSLSDNTVRTLPAVSVQSFAVQGERYDQSRERFYYDDFYAMRQGYYYGNPLYTMPVPRRRERPDTALVRVFRVYRWNRDNDYSDFRAPGFFEQLSGGPVILLRREGLVQRPVTAAGPYGYGYGYGPGGLAGRTMGYYTDVKDSFFLGLPTGSVLSLRNPKKDLLAYFRTASRQIEQYAKDNKLSYTDARELAYLVNYANSLGAAGK